jgi:hypothetical protein
MSLKFSGKRTAQAGLLKRRVGIDDKVLTNSDHVVARNRPRLDVLGDGC